MAKQVKGGLQRRMEDGLVPDADTCGTESNVEESNDEEEASAGAQEAAVDAEATDAAATGMDAAAAGGPAAAVEQEAAAEAAAIQLQKWWKDCIARKSAAAGAELIKNQSLRGTFHF